MPRRIRLEPDTDLYLHQRSRHGIGGCAKNRIARCVLDEPRRYARTSEHDYLRRVLKARRDYGLIDNAEMDFPLVTGAHRVHEAVIDRRD